MLLLETEENLLKSIYFIDRVVYPCVLLTSYNLRFIIQEHFFTYDDSKLFSLKLQVLWCWRVNAQKYAKEISKTKIIVKISLQLNI